jgi:hypothetical protein
MSATAQPAQGAVLSYSINSGSTWVTVGEVTHIKGAGASEMGKRDTTVLVSALHTARPTIPTIGPFTFGVNYDPTDTAHPVILAWANTPATTDPEWKILFNIATTPNSCTFTGFVESADGIDAEDVDSNLTGEFSIFINSVPVWA